MFQLYGKAAINSEIFSHDLKRPSSFYTSHGFQWVPWLMSTEKKCCSLIQTLPWEHRVCTSFIWQSSSDIYLGQRHFNTLQTTNEILDHILEIAVM